MRATRITLCNPPFHAGHSHHPTRQKDFAVTATITRKAHCAMWRGADVLQALHASGHRRCDSRHPAEDENANRCRQRLEVEHVTHGRHTHPHVQAQTQTQPARDVYFTFRVGF